MKKSLSCLLISVLLALTMVATSCTTNRTTSSNNSQQSSYSQEGSSQNSGTQSSSSIELIDPTQSATSSGVVNPSVNGNPSGGASAVDPTVSSAPSGTTSSSSEWLPDINDYDNVTPNYAPGFDTSTKYDYSAVTYTTKSGSFNTNGTAYTTSTGNSIAVNTNSATPFPYGTISADVSYLGGDSGIIFGYSNTSGNNWEGAGTEATCMMFFNKENKTINLAYYSAYYEAVYGVQNQFRISFADTNNPAIGA